MTYEFHTESTTGVERYWITSEIGMTFGPWFVRWDALHKLFQLRRAAEQ